MKLKKGNIIWNSCLYLPNNCNYWNISKTMRFRIYNGLIKHCWNPFQVNFNKKTKVFFFLEHLIKINIYIYILHNFLMGGWLICNYSDELDAVIASVSLHERLNLLALAPAALFVHFSFMSCKLFFYWINNKMQFLLYYLI